MLLILNKYSCGNKALRKWDKAKNTVLSRYPGLKILTEYNEENLCGILNNELKKGEKYFIAGGGDGTVNLLLNAIMSPENTEFIDSISLGAVGLGSSNDFHKPFRDVIEGIPLKINFRNADKHDVGVLEIKSSGDLLRKYWIINSSIGLTADANHFFNHPDRILRFLKSKVTSAAILYAAFKTISLFRNKHLRIILQDNSENDLYVTNIGIVKNPNFSGNFSYKDDYQRSNGLFNVHTCFCDSKFSVLRMLKYLSSPGKNGNKNIISNMSNNISIESDEKFFVEYDGEIIQTNKVKFFIIPKLLNVCAN